MKKSVSSKIALQCTLLLTLLVNLLQTAIFSEVTSFKDVSVNFWANEAIMSMSDENMIKGYPDGTFRPYTNVTREEFAAIICNAFNLELKKSPVPSFTDVSSTRWSYDYIEAAKDYLTGYQIGDSKSRFNPPGLALREDVAVALVKVMKLEIMDSDPEGYLKNQFSDWDSISPGLYKEISAAVNFKLVSGFPDHTFKGNQPIDRASVAAIIFRAIKTSNKNTAVQSQLSVEMPEKTNVPMVSILVKTELGNRLYINDEQVPMTHASKQIDLEPRKGEGHYQFDVKIITPQGKMLTVTKSVSYIPDAPLLELDPLGSESTVQTLLLKGFLKDALDTNPRLWINDQKISLMNEGRFETKIILKEGANRIKLKGTNSLGKSVEKLIDISYIASGPIIDISGLPIETADTYFKVRGKITDPTTDNGPIIAYLMGKELSLNLYDGTFSAETRLKDGPNLIALKATNKLGKTTEVTHTINFNPKSPDLLVYDQLDRVHHNELKLIFRVDDAYDSQINLFVNNAVKGYFRTGESQSILLPLAPGENTFNFKVINSKGKESSQKRTYFYEPLPPEIKVLSENQTAFSRYELNGTINDPLGLANLRILKINGKEMPLKGNVFSYPFELIEGLNTFEIEAFNHTGQSVKLSFPVIYTKPKPQILTTIPAETTHDLLLLNGSVYDVSDPSPLLVINDTPVAYSRSGFWSHTVKLSSGDNLIRIVATNSSKQVTVIEKKVILTK